MKGYAVQRIGWILAVLLALGWLASEIPLQNASSNDQSRVQTCWRRTVDGWENASQWTFYPISQRRVFHPVYFGMIQCAAVAWITISSCLIKFIARPKPNRLPHDKKNATLLESNPNST
jgi:hypothetical protein